MDSCKQTGTKTNKVFFSWKKEQKIKGVQHATLKYLGRRWQQNTRERDGEREEKEEEREKERKRESTRGCD